MQNVLIKPKKFDLIKMLPTAIDPQLRGVGIYIGYFISREIQQCYHVVYINKCFKKYLTLNTFYTLHNQIHE